MLFPPPPFHPARRLARVDPGTASFTSSNEPPHPHDTHTPPPSAHRLAHSLALPFACPRSLADGQETWDTGYDKSFFKALFASIRAGTFGVRSNGGNPVPLDLSRMVVTGCKALGMLEVPPHPPTPTHTHTHQFLPPLRVHPATVCTMTKLDRGGEGEQRPAAVAQTSVAGTCVCVCVPMLPTSFDQSPL